MTIIETIKAEIERRMKENQKNATESGSGAFYEDKAILAVLDTIEEQPVNLDIRKELASIEFMGVNDARDSETIARHFANIGWNKGYIKGREDAHKPARDVGLPKRFDKQPVCEGLEEEIKTRWNILNRAGNDIPFDTFNGIACHFAQWQKEQMTEDAVEGEVVKDISNKLAVTAKINLDGFKFGQKVKIFIVKED